MTHLLRHDRRVAASHLCREARRLRAIPRARPATATTATYDEDLARSARAPTSVRGDGAPRTAATLARRDATLGHTARSARAARPSASARPRPRQRDALRIGAARRIDRRRRGRGAACAVARATDRFALENSSWNLLDAAESMQYTLTSFEARSSCRSSSTSSGRSSWASHISWPCFRCSPCRCIYRRCLGPARPGRGRRNAPQRAREASETAVLRAQRGTSDGVFRLVSCGRSPLRIQREARAASPHRKPSTRRRVTQTGAPQWGHPDGRAMARITMPRCARDGRTNHFGA